MKKVRSYIALASVAVVSFIFLFGLGWWVLSSRTIANVPLVMQVRKSYFYDLLPKIGILPRRFYSDIIATGYFESVSGGRYSYSMRGRFEKADLDNQILYLRLSGNLLWGFKYSLKQTPVISYRELENGVFVLKNSSDSPLVKGDIITVQWTDGRLLDKVYSDAYADQNLLVNRYVNESNVILITRHINE